MRKFGLTVDRFAESYRQPAELLPDADVFRRHLMVPASWGFYRLSTSPDDEFGAEAVLNDLARCSFD